MKGHTGDMVWIAVVCVAYVLTTGLSIRTNVTTGLQSIKDRQVTFLDTPGRGHSTAIRMRGAQSTGHCHPGNGGCGQA